MYPGTDRSNDFPEVDFTEELLMGYRWYDSQGNKPQWVFGHGLSFSTFTYVQQPQRQWPHVLCQQDLVQNKRS
jgi:hypothetical protein